MRGAGKRRWNPLKFFNKPAVYFIMGTENAIGCDPLELLEAALAGGIDVFQLREKGPSALKGAPLKEFAEECQRLCRAYKVPFIVNDDILLAIDIGADGVHVGQDDAAAKSVRRSIGKDKILGVSVHSIEEAARAVKAGADYVGMGPVFATQSKADAKVPAGAGVIRAVKAVYPDLPIVGIGGITPENAPLVWSAGAEGVAAISAIAGAEDIKLQVSRFKNSSKAGAIQ
jgi:thiamine-phosphate pyrophosphorylase